MFQIAATWAKGVGPEGPPTSAGIGRPGAAARSAKKNGPPKRAVLAIVRANQFMPTQARSELRLELHADDARVVDETDQVV
ncbi:DUF6053 domain-containing protein, partial [Staphylococcus pseudintermedius]|nr:DUF6053 domain-containing protein [Staphylococcus pseudintermedius]